MHIIFNKRLLSCFIVIGLIISFVNISNAKDRSKKIDSNTTFIKHITCKEELIADGLTDEEASNIINIQNIMKAIKQNGQRIKGDNEKYYLSRPSLFKKAITKEDEKKILSLFNQLPSIVTDDNKKVFNELNKVMEEKMDQCKFKTSFEHGSWIKVEFEDETNEQENYTSDIYNQKGEKTINFITKIYYPMHYCKVNIKYTYEVSDNNKKVELKDLKQEISYAGMFEVDQTSTEIFINETNINEDPEIWCSGGSEVMWKNNQDILECDYFCYWTQVQNIDISLIRRHHRIN